MPELKGQEPDKFGLIDSKFVDRARDLPWKAVDWRDGRYRVITADGRTIVDLPSTDENGEICVFIADSCNSRA